MLALALAGAEALLALGGASFPALSGLVLLLAPGLALVPLLPARTRTSLTASLAAAPVLGAATSSILLISLSSAGIELNGLAVRVAVVVLVVAALALLPGAEPAWDRSPAAVYGAVGLLAAVVAGVVMQNRVIGGTPVPGNDWAKYVLYADEVRAQGSLLIDNPYWMLGAPFREDPGVPAVYGGYLVMTGLPAAVLAHGIWPFAVMAILSVYALTRSLWGELAGVVAAGLFAVLPITHDILAWHGLPNVAALSLASLILLYVTTLLLDEVRGPQAAGLALLLVAIAAYHRLSAVLIGTTILASIAFRLVRRPRGAALRALFLTTSAVAVLAPLVVHDLVTRARTFGGTIDYRSYLSSKLDLTLVASDLTLPFSGVALVAVVLALLHVRRDVRLLPILCLLAVTLAMAYSWLVQLPLVYFRMAFYLPIALAPLVAVALARHIPSRRVPIASAVLVAAIALVAWPRAHDVRAFYAFANMTSLRGLDLVARDLRPGEVVVTDRCWSFLGTWLLHTPTLPALEPEDIQPKAELQRSREAKAILAGTPHGRALARELGVRYIIVDPSCPAPSGEALDAPRIGRPAFISERLVVLRLDQPIRSFARKEPNG